ncbi:TetR/AcrR family transcriptional regulator [Myxococcaceae bacterium JPH2]|nr:TetR/AcrR family transcriptional regulator [Myxococcaceae bacterium JPH2]
MPRPRRVLDEQIRATAREVFLEKGPSAPLQLIARRLGISQAALLHRVGTKEALMLLALRPETPSAAALLAREPARAGDLEEQLVAALLHHRDFLRGLIPNLFVLRCSPLGVERAMHATPPPPVALRRRLASWLARARRDGLTPVDNPKHVAEALCGTVEARCFNAHVGGARYTPGDDEAILRELVRLLVPVRRAPRPLKRKAA